MTVAAPTHPKYLAIYLNDHLMGSTTGIELVNRIAAEHEGTELGTVASGLAREIAEDRDTLMEIMDQLGASTDRAKVAMGWISEKAHRLKPNGDLRGHSPLTPLIELESLSLGIEGKRSLWMALRESESVATRIGRPRLDQLIARAEGQREQVEEQRRAAARTTLAAP